AFTALTVRKLRIEGKNPIGTADLEWIFARNCEGTEPLRHEVKKIRRILKMGTCGSFFFCNRNSCEMKP
ncbi:hypothetical protein KH141_10905, partial [butyrate-producing bacterium]|nr:hypothetical protein [butyrate-producing bacterium]